MSDVLEFSLKKIEIPVKIDDVDYVLVEASAEAAKKFKDYVIASTRFEKGKPSGVKDLAASETLLLSECLFKLDGVNRSQVHTSTLLNWPNKVTTALFEKVKKISLLNEANPAAVGLGKALLLPNSPVNLEKFTEYINSLEGEDYEQLQDLVEAANEESKAKN